MVRGYVRMSLSAARSRRTQRRTAICHNRLLLSYPVERYCEFNRKAFCIPLMRNCPSELRANAVIRNNSSEALAFWSSADFRPAAFLPFQDEISIKAFPAYGELSFIR